MAADEPMFTETRGDGICKSKSNATEPANDVVVVEAIVVAGAAVVVAEAMVVVEAMVAAGILAAAGAGVAGGATAIGVAAGGATVPRSTLFRLIVVVGSNFTWDAETGFFTAGFLSAGFFTTGFLITAFLAAFAIAALFTEATEEGATANESALIIKRTDG